MLFLFLKLMSATKIVNADVALTTHPNKDNGPIGVTLVDARNGFNKLKSHDSLDNMSLLVKRKTFFFQLQPRPITSHCKKQRKDSHNTK